MGLCCFEFLPLFLKWYSKLRLHMAFPRSHTHKHAYFQTQVQLKSQQRRQNGILTDSLNAERKKRWKREPKYREQSQQLEIDIVDLTSTMSISTLNINKLSTLKGKDCQCGFESQTQQYAVYKRPTLNVKCIDGK